jgi:outer membrane protein assembly factor BamE (lipoprotein component of BamABCDE complex)
MKLTLQLAIITIAGVILAGCASVGNNFDENKVSQIRKGETTEADLVQMFGQPQGRGMNSEGQANLTWMYTQANVKGESFIPFAGAFVGGTQSKSKTLTVVLQDGKVKSFTSSGGGMESRGTTQDVPKQ